MYASDTILGTPCPQLNFLVKIRVTPIVMYEVLPSFVLGFHGCDRSVGENVLSGKTRLRKSSNDYDWLGNGIYFWENNPQRGGVTLFFKSLPLQFPSFFCLDTKESKNQGYELLDGGLFINAAPFEWSIMLTDGNQRLWPLIF